MEKRKYKPGDKVVFHSYDFLIRKLKEDKRFVANVAGKKAVVKDVYPSGIYSLQSGDKTYFCRDDCFYPDSIAEPESRKNDRKDDKVMMELLPWPELEKIAEVYTAGAKKYGPHNWENLPDGYERYKGAMLRHLTEMEKGNDIDPDTGCMHAAQVAWNAIAMLHFKMNKK